jgi:hypothetical protein
MPSIGHSLAFYLSHYEDMEFFYRLSARPNGVLQADWEAFQTVKEHALDQGRVVVSTALEVLASTLNHQGRLEPRTRDATARAHWYSEGHLFARGRRTALGWGGATIVSMEGGALKVWLCYRSERRMRAQVLAERLSGAGVANIALGEPPIFPNPGLVIFGTLPLRSETTLEDCERFIKRAVSETLLPHWQEVLAVAEL